MVTEDGAVYAIDLIVRNTPSPEYIMIGVPNKDEPNGVELKVHPTSLIVKLIQNHLAIASEINDEFYNTYGEVIDKYHEELLTEAIEKGGKDDFVENSLNKITGIADKLEKEFPGCIDRDAVAAFCAAYRAIKTDTVPETELNMTTKIVNADPYKIKIEETNE